MCLQCEPYRPGLEDTTSTDEQGAARAEQDRATWMVLTTQADIDAAVAAGKDTVQPIAWAQLTPEQATAQQQRVSRAQACHVLWQAGIPEPHIDAAMEAVGVLVAMQEWTPTDAAELLVTVINTMGVGPDQYLSAARAVRRTRDLLAAIERRTP